MCDSIRYCCARSRERVRIVMDITESVAASRRYDVAREYVAACKGLTDAFESQMYELASQFDALHSRIRTISSPVEKAKLIALRDDVLSALANAERCFIRAQEELAYAQRALSLIEQELDQRVNRLVIPQPTTAYRER